MIKNSTQMSPHVCLMFPGPSRSLQHYRPPWRPVSVWGRRPQVVPHRYLREEGRGRAQLRRSGCSGPDHPDGLWRQIKHSLSPGFLIKKKCNRFSASFHLNVLTTPGRLKLLFIYEKPKMCLLFWYDKARIIKVLHFWFGSVKLHWLWQLFFLFHRYQKTRS